MGDRFVEENEYCRKWKSRKVRIEDPNSSCPLSDDARHSSVRPNSNPLDTNDRGKTVFPWMGVVANIKTEWKDGKPVGDSGSKLRNELIRKGYNPVKVHPLWSRDDHSTFSIVQFKRSWEGYMDALKFDKDFAVMGCGRADYFRLETRMEDKLYGWIAGDLDYRSTYVAGNFLRKNTDLKSPPKVAAEFERKDSTLVNSLNNTLAEKRRDLREMERKYDESISQKNTMMESCKEEIRKEQQNLDDVFKEHERFKHELESRKRELEQREINLREREAHNENEMRKLSREREILDKRAILEKKVAVEQFKLYQQHQREKEAFHRKGIELQAHLDAKHALELEIEHWKHELWDLEHLEEGESPEIREMKEKLEEKENELEFVVAGNQTFMTKNEKVEQELGAARKYLINTLKGLGHAGRATIGIREVEEGKGMTKAEDLWHLNEDRKATVAEGVEYILGI